MSKSSLSKEDCFDEQATRILTRKRRKIVLEHPEQYRFIDPHCVLDCLPPKTEKTYEFNFRMVRIKRENNEYECLITNLPQEEFPVERLNELYAMRWGIETSFCDLKHAAHLDTFHAKKAEFVLQEIYARLILYNFSEIIIGHVAIEQGKTKYMYQCNNRQAIHICLEFLRKNGRVIESEVEGLIRRNLVPIRPGRSAPRKVRPQAFVDFQYR